MFQKTLIETECFRLSEPVPIKDKTALEPDVAYDSQGRLWVVWCERGRGSDHVRLRRYGTDGLVELDVPCSTTRGTEFQPTLVDLASGDIVVAWSAFRNGSWQILARTCQENELGEEQTLADNPAGLFRPRLLRDRNGECWLVCEVVDQNQPRMMVLHTSEGTWSQPKRARTPEASCYRACLSNGPEGGVWMTYDVYQNGHYQVLLQRLDTASDPIPVSNNDYHNLQSSVAEDNEGNLWIAWTSNQNAAHRDRWWLTKYFELRRFDGKTFSDPVSPPLEKDIYNEDSFQGWEFPAVTVDTGGRVWVFGQATHTLYAQYYSGSDWSPRHTIAIKKWGTWKPRTRVANAGNALYVASMGLDGVQLQRLDLTAAASVPPMVHACREPLPALSIGEPERKTPTITGPNGEALSIFFGDLHAHSAYGDAAGDVDEFYHRYRDGYRYDFACLTEHDFLDGIELSQSELKFMWNHSDRITKPGEFLGIYGYEWTSPAISEHAEDGSSVGEGHKHVLYPTQSGPLVSYGEETANTGAKILKQLKGTSAIVISHHTSWSGVDLDAHDPELQRLIEICSTHGRFEYPGNKPIGYRRDHVHPGKFVIDALHRGYRLGFVGGSDSHGLMWHGTEMNDRDGHILAGTRIGWKRDAYRTGMTAVIAPELTREAIHDALYNRRSYATSGVPITLDFRIEGALMGSEITAGVEPEISVDVQGTAALRSIEIIRSGHVFGGIHCREGEAISRLSFKMNDTLIVPGEEHFFYARITQEDGNMAWSSPIWVTCRS